MEMISDDDTDPQYSLTLKRQQLPKKQQKGQNRALQLGGGRARSKDKDSMIYSNRASIRNNNMKKDSYAHTFGKRSKSSRSGLEQMTAGQKNIKVKYVVPEEDFGRVEYGATFPLSSQGKAVTGQNYDMNLGLTSKFKGTQNAYNEDYQKSVDVHSRAFNSNREHNNTKIEQFVYEPFSGINDDQLTGQKQVMLLYDDTSMDDESDSESYFGLEHCRSEILEMPVDPLSQPSTYFHAMSPVKSQQNLTVDTHAQLLMSQTHHTQQANLFESPNKKKRGGSNSFKAAKQTTNQQGSPGPKKQQNETIMHDKYISPTIKSKAVNKSVSTFTMSSKSKDGMPTGGRFRKTGARPSSKYKLKTEFYQNSGKSSSQATDSMQQNKADYYSMMSQQKQPRQAVIRKKQLSKNNLFRQSEEKFRDENITHNRPMPAGQHYQRRLKTIKTYGGEQQLTQDQNEQLLEQHKQQTVQQMYHQDLVESQRINKSNKYQVGQHTIVQPFNQYKELTMHQQLIQDTNTNMRKNQITNYMTPSMTAAEKYMTATELSEQQIGQQINLMIPSSELKQSIKKNSSYKFNTNRRLVPASKNHTRAQSFVKPQSPSCSKQARNQDINQRADYFSVPKKAPTLSNKRKLLKSAKNRSEKQKIVNNMRQKGQELESPAGEGLQMTQQDIELFKQIKNLVNSHNQQVGASSWSQNLQFS